MEGMQIRVAPEILAQRADAAERKIKDVRQRFEQIHQIVNRSQNYWEGNANQAHRREYQEYLDEIEKVLLHFEENVTDLRKIGGIYKAVETVTTETSHDLPRDVII